MLNLKEKQNSLEELDRVAKRYASLGNDIQQDSIELFELRKQTSHKVIQAAEAYINLLANAPKEFDKSVSEFRIAIDRFDEVIHSIKIEAHDVTIKSGVSAAASVGTGAAVASLAPTAAMALATTFGTASTGTAISALSGAAATNAALAWLGGGALAAGGGGMAGGHALLALAGPAGWAIAGFSLLGTGIWVNHENAKIAQLATEEAAAISARTRALKAARAEIAEIIKLTCLHYQGALAQLEDLRTTAPTDYRQFSEAERVELASLINNIHSLSRLLNRQLA